MRRLILGRRHAAAGVRRPQAGASFNLDAVKAELRGRMAEASATTKGPGN